MVWRDGSDDSYPVGPRLRDAGTLAELIGLVIVFQLSAGWHLLEYLKETDITPNFLGCDSTWNGSFLVVCLED